MFKYSKLTILCFCTQVLTAQNIVRNPSFEELDSNAIVVACEFMQRSQFFDEKIKYWTTSRGMTPDILRAAENCTWLKQVHTGEFCLGLIHYLPAADIGQRQDYHERVLGKLSVPLRPGQRYQVSCWVREDSTIVRSHLAMVYAEKTPVVPVQAGNLGIYFFSRAPRENPKPQVNFTEVIITGGKWVKLTAEFVPDEPFDQFMIGNFFSDKTTLNTLSPDKIYEIEQKNYTLPTNVDKIKRAGYLCIDDISVELMAPPTDLEQTLLTARKFTFSAAALFDSGKSNLRPTAAVELDSLVAFMKKYPKNRIGISGYTDSDGPEIFNLNLSEQRANSVKTYLLKQGIAETQLLAKGFGETKPVADNTTEQGKQLNRRVECILLKTN